MMFRSRVIAAATAAGLVFPLAASAEESPFEGKTIEWTIPYSKGSDTDQWARFLAPYLSRTLPGNPEVEIKNRPGEAATTGTNDFAERDDEDGFELIGTSAANQLTFLLDDPRVDYDYEDWTALLASPDGMACAVRPDLGVSGPDDAGKLLEIADLHYGSQGPTTVDMVPLLAMDLLGLDVDAVDGVENREAARVGFEEGRLQIDCQMTAAWNAKMKPLIEAGKAVPVFALGHVGPHGDIVRDPAFPDLPTVAELYKNLHGEAPEGEGWKAYRAVLFAGFAGQKMLFVSDDAPYDIIEAYWKALRKAVASPEFTGEAAERIGGYPQALGETASGLLRAALDVPPDSRTWLKSWLANKYSVKF